MTSYIIPCLLAFVMIFALRRGTDVYDALVSGAENGLTMTFHIVPALVALLTGVSMLRASGALDSLSALLRPAAEALGVLAAVLLHLWRRSSLLSIAGATVLYMVLVQAVF